ncbi:MAG: serine protease [Rhodoferax sp.]|nr:serine protease [Rhodoferax sp.]
MTQQALRRLLLAEPWTGWADGVGVCHACSIPQRGAGAAICGTARPGRRLLPGTLTAEPTGRSMGAHNAPDRPCPEVWPSPTEPEPHQEPAMRLPHPIRLCLMGWLLLAGGLAAAQPADKAAVERLQRAQDAVVQITAQAIDESSSSSTLGRLRMGSGVVIGPDDLILTIGYLILEAERIEIRTRDGRTFPARSVAYDQASGLGLVRPLIPLRTVQPVAVAATRPTDRGQPHLVVRGETAGTVTPARLVDVRPFTGYWEYHLQEALYTSPPFGNHSGAGLFNLEGELVGIGSLYMPDILPDNDPNRLPGNLFVPSALLPPILAEMLATGSSAQSRRAWLGVNAVERNGRIQLTRITPDSPADKGGLQPGDWVLALAGTRPASLADFYQRLWATPLESGRIKLTVLRGSQPRVVELEVRDRGRSLLTPKGI